MNPQLAFVANRQFWAGVAATIVVGILVALGVAHLMRTRMALYDTESRGHQIGTRLEEARGGAGYTDNLMMVASLSGDRARAEDDPDRFDGSAREKPKTDI